MAGCGVPSIHRCCSSPGVSSLPRPASLTASSFTGDGGRLWASESREYGCTRSLEVPFRCVKLQCGTSSLSYLALSEYSSLSPTWPTADPLTRTLPQVLLTSLHLAW